MTGYVGTKFAESYGIVVDFVDPELTELVRVRIPILIYFFLDSAVAYQSQG